MPVYGLFLYQITGLYFLLPLFLATIIASPLLRQPRLMRYHIALGKYTILVGLVHMFFALSALFFGYLP